MEPDINRIRSYVRDTLDTAHDCVIEVFLKDIIHLRNLEQRIKEFSVLLREETVVDP
jgi:hypothetical protein